ncbi:MAG: hypothetical protein A2Z88_00140 [Omnitrophica WOR_2 bacterium GWA2_47_8]|nr:MAG: hypothetical protein A2Z88_00140 [Omnitrophica WOR_2 bacterium GWA2_47_8]
MFSVEFSRRAGKFVESAPRDAARRLISAADALRKEPFPRGAIKVKGTGSVFRIRVGAYRITYEIYFDRQAILIADVDKRGRIYENF